MANLRFYQAIVTKYIGPSNTKGSRIKATAAPGSITLHLDHSLNSEQNHAAAALALATKYKWRGTWYGGGMPNYSGYVFVSTDVGDGPAFITLGEGMTL